jgi:hypothetical protein
MTSSRTATLIYIAARFRVNDGQSNFEFEYMGEFETEFVYILGYESEAKVCYVDGKNQRSKISCFCPFKCVEYRHEFLSAFVLY